MKKTTLDRDRQGREAKLGRVQEQVASGDW
jgi:hypothetical protein